MDKVSQSASAAGQYSPPWRMTLTICLYILFFTFGLVASVLGPTLVHIGYLYHTDVFHTSMALASASSGYTLGSLVCGMLHDSINKEMQFFLLYLLIGGLSILAPWVPTMNGFYCVILFQNLGMGYCEAAMQPYIVNLWKGHQFQGPVVVGLNTLWTVGMFVGPFITGYYLIDINSAEITGSLSLYHIPIFTGNSSDFVLPLNDALNNTSGFLNGSSLEGLELVRIPYFIMGISTAVGSVVFLIIFIYFKSKPLTYRLLLEEQVDEENIQKSRSSTNTADDVTVNQRLTPSVEVLVLCLSCIFAFFLLMIFSLPNGFLSTFAIKGLGWSTKSATLLASVFSGMQVFGRLIGIPLSFYLKPGVILMSNSCLALCGYSVLLVAALIDLRFLVWIAVAICGLAVSNTFPTLLLWIAKNVRLTGKNSSIIFVGGSVGGALGAVLTGYLFCTYSHLWFVYICLIACTTDLLVLLALLGMLRLKCFGKSIKVRKGESAYLYKVNRRYSSKPIKSALPTRELGFTLDKLC